MSISHIHVLLLSAGDLEIASHSPESRSNANSAPFSHETQAHEPIGRSDGFVTGDACLRACCYFPWLSTVSAFDGFRADVGLRPA